MSILTFTIMLLLSTSLHAGEEASQKKLKDQVRARVICSIFCEGSFKSGFHASRSDFNPYNQLAVAPVPQMHRCLRICNEAVAHIGASEVVQFSDRTYTEWYPFGWPYMEGVAETPESYRDGVWWRIMKDYFSDALKCKPQRSKSR